jgi:hypothetical protein
MLPQWQRKKTVLNDRLQDCSTDSTEGEVLTGMISLWRPEAELVEHLSENSRFKIFGLVANSIRDKEIQFRATKQTKFIKNEKCSKNQKSENEFSEFRRQFTDIGDIISSENFCPKFHEVDVVGIVVEVSDKKSRNQFEQNSSR